MKQEAILTGNFKKAFWAVCIAGIAALLLLLIPICGDNRRYEYSIDEELSICQDEPFVLQGGISLPVGIYAAEITYRTEADFAYSVFLNDDSLPELKVMQNTQSLAAAHTSETFRLWLLAGTDALSLFVNGDSGQPIYFDSLTLTETNQLWYLAGFAIVMLCLFLLFIIFGVACYRAKRIGKQDLVIAGLTVVLTVLLSRPFLMNWISLTGDVGYHLERIDGVATSITDGVFPMRLEANFPFGYGYADGVLYGSTLLYVPAILWLIGFPVMYAYNLFIIFINFATILVALYCFSKMFGDKFIGLMCSALYAFSLYRITVLYGRGCVGEGCAQVFMPLLVYGYYRLFTGDRKEKSYKNTWLILALGYSGILQSHTLSCELALIWTCVVCLFQLRRVFRKETLLELAKGAGAAVLLNAWYAVPFLDYYISENFQIKNIGKQPIQYQGISPKLVFVHFFDGLLVDEAGNNIRAVGPGLIPMLALFALVGIAVYARIKGKRSAQLSAAGVCAALSFVCILFSLKIFPWDAIQQLNPVTERIVSSFLIPTRFLNWGTLFMVPAFGGCLWYAKKECGRKLFYWLGVAAVLLTVGTSSMYFIHQVTHTYSKARVFDNNLIVGYVSGGEYVIYGTDTSGMTYRLADASENVELLSYEKGDLSAKFACVNRSGEEGYVDLPLFLYKGYRAYAGSGGELPCVYGNNNVIRVLIPDGFSDEVSVRFVSPVYWRISEGISAAAWLGVLCLWAFGARSACKRAGVPAKEQER